MPTNYLNVGIFRLVPLFGGPSEIPQIFLQDNFLHTCVCAGVVVASIMVGCFSTVMPGCGVTVLMACDCAACKEAIVTRETMSEQIYTGFMIYALLDISTLIKIRIFLPHLPKIF